MKGTHMINVQSIQTDRGTYQPIRCFIEDSTIGYAIDFTDSAGEYMGDVATFRVFNDGSAEGFDIGQTISVIENESKVVAELVKAIEEQQ